MTESEHVRPPQDLLRIAAEYRWLHPGATWQEVAQQVDRNVRQVQRWRETEAWEIAFREAGAEYVERLAPAAISALLKAWAKGNPTGALDVLRSFGLLRQQEVGVTVSTTASLDEEISAILGALAAAVDSQPPT